MYLETSTNTGVSIAV